MVAYFCITVDYQINFAKIYQSSMENEDIFAETYKTFREKNFFH